MTDPKMLKIGKAALELTKTWPITAILIGLFSPCFASRFHSLIEAMAAPLEDGAFGKDSELGL